MSKLWVLEQEGLSFFFFQWPVIVLPVQVKYQCESTDFTIVNQVLPP